MKDPEVEQWKLGLETFEDKLSDELGHATEDVEDSVAWDIMYAVRGIARAVRHTIEELSDEE